MSIEYLGFPDGGRRRVSSGLISAGSELILQAPTCEDLISVYGFVWPENLVRVVFGDIIMPDALSVRGTSQRKTLVFLTSGSMAKPKPILVDLETILSPPKTKKSPDKLVWGHFYDNSRIASHNVVAHSLATGGLLAERANDATYRELVDFYVKAGVTAIAGTPSIMRALLALESFRGLRLRQLSLGGEVVDAPLLSTLMKTFPAARISHIYATTETGSLFSVSDGKPGFPSSLLKSTLRGDKTLEIVDGRLLVHDQRNGKSWDTGDMVELVDADARVYFRGRVGGIINVGGRKVSIAKVREAVLAFPEVLGCRVFPVPNAFLGEVVGVEISAAVSESTKLDILASLRDRLEKWERPSVVYWVEDLKLGPNGKTIDRLGVPHF